MEKATWMEKAIIYHWKQGTAADPVSSAEDLLRGNSQHGAAQLYSKTSSSNCSYAMNLKSINPPLHREQGQSPPAGL